MRQYSGYIIADFNEVLADDVEELEEFLEKCLGSAYLKLKRVEVIVDETYFRYPEADYDR